MGDGVNQGEEDDGPGDGLVEGDGLVKGNDPVQGRGTQPGDQGAADRQEDDTRVDMEDQGGPTGGGQGDTEDGTGILEVVRVEIVEEGESKEADVHQDPETKKDGTVSCLLEDAAVIVSQGDKQKWRGGSSVQADKEVVRSCDCRSVHFVRGDIRSDQPGNTGFVQPPMHSSTEQAQPQTGTEEERECHSNFKGKGKEGERKRGRREREREREEKNAVSVSSLLPLVPFRPFLFFYLFLRCIPSIPSIRSSALELEGANKRRGRKRAREKEFITPLHSPAFPLQAKRQTFSPPHLISSPTQMYRTFVDHPDANPLMPRRRCLGLASLHRSGIKRLEVVQLARLLMLLQVLTIARTVGPTAVLLAGALAGAHLLQSEICR